MEDALRLIADGAGRAKILAGGQSLIPMLNLRLFAPAAVVDINRLKELSYIRIEGAEVKIGAMTRHRAIEDSAELRGALPILPARSQTQSRTRLRPLAQPLMRYR